MLDDREPAELAALSDLAYNAIDREVRDHAAEALRALRREIYSHRTPPAG
jgi:hypothetical protein